MGPGQAGRQPGCPPVAARGGNRRRRRRRLGTRRQQVTQREQPAPGGLEHRHAGVAEPGGDITIDRGGHRGEHRHRLGGPRRHREHGVRVGVVAVELGHQVHGQRHRADARVAGQRGQRAREELLAVPAGPPQIQWVRHLEARVEHVREPLPGRVFERSELHPRRRGHVRHVRPLESRVVHGREATSGRRGRAAARAEQLEGVRQFREITDEVHAVGGRQRLPRAVARRQGAGVRGHHRPAVSRRARGQQDDRDVAFGGGGEDGAQRGGIPDRLEDEGEGLGLGQAERVPRVRGGFRDEFLPGGDREREPERPPAAQQGREHRTGVGDQRDRPRRQRVGLGVADRPQSPRHVHEPHAARAAQRERGLLRDGRDPHPQGWRVSRVKGRPEYQHRTGGGVCADLHLLLERGVGHREQRQVHGAWQRAQARV